MVTWVMMLFAYMSVGTGIWAVGMDPNDDTISSSPWQAHIIVLLMMILAWPIVLACWFSWRE